MINPVIVTGSSGFIGRHLLPLLSAKDRTVVAVDRDPPGDSLPTGIRFHRSDLSDPATLIPSDLDLSNGFCLIHLAWDMRRGSNFVPQTKQVQLLAGLLDYWAARGLQRFVGLGSAEEYGQRSGLIHEYDPPVEPLSPYGWGKHAAWQMAQSWGLREQRDVFWLRPFLVYGPGQKGSMAIPYAVHQFRSGQIAVCSDGLQERDFVHVTDVARAIALASQATLSGVHVVNIGTGQPTAVRDVLMRIAEQMSAIHLLKLGERPRRAGEPERQVAAVGLAKGLLGWRAQISWEKGVRTLEINHKERKEHKEGF